MRVSVSVCGDVWRPPPVLEMNDQGGENGWREEHLKKRGEETNGKKEEKVSAGKRDRGRKWSSSEG